MQAPVICIRAITPGNCRVHTAARFQCQEAAYTCYLLAAACHMNTANGTARHTEVVLMLLAILLDVCVGNSLTSSSLTDLTF